MNATHQDWLQANQHHLMAEVAMIRECLERHAGGSAIANAGAREMPSEAETKLAAARQELSAPSTLDSLCEMFRLSPFERSVLLLCAGPELEGAFAARCAAAHGDLTRPYPTFGLALAVLPYAHWSALTPLAPLRRWRLIEVGAGSSLTASPLRIDERVLHYLTGVPQIDERLFGLVEPMRASGELASSHRLLAERLAQTWSAGANGDIGWPAIQLCGEEPVAKRAIAQLACARLNLNLYAMSAHVIPTSATEFETLLRLWERETVLSGCALLLECDDAESPDAARASAVRRWIENSGWPLLIASREPCRVARRPLITLDVRKPPGGEQRVIWEQTLGENAVGLNGQLDLLVSQFNLSTSAIRAACVSAGQLAPGSGAMSLHSTAETRGALWQACRIQARPRLEDLAQRIDSTATWDDLVLPESPAQTLREIAIHVRQRAKVYETWGFAAKSPRGLGINALFAGPSGTGKTLAAEVLACELGLDLYRIDLSSVVSKYIGETEKNLRRVFDAAEEGGAVLLFDEADALFGKRSEVKDSHDRYANIEVSYLLQRMEAYRGLAILTTNMKEALDTAFLRRLRFIVQFPFPDLAQRAQIWQRIFPRATPTESFDAARLARLCVAGGNIRNIALNAAFLAAEAGEPVRMSHLLTSARGEYAKLEKPLTEAELGGVQ